MNRQFEQLFSRASHGTADLGPMPMLLSMLLAFVLGQLVAWTYKRTHSGLSYSRSFTESIVLITMVVSMVMFIIGDSIVTAFGLIGALAIIRFRNVLKDTRDTVFVFYALVLGMALGSQLYGLAIMGTMILLSATAYLTWVRFGANAEFDGHLSFRLDEGGEESATRAVIHRFCRRFDCLSVRHGVGVTEYVFVVSLRDTLRGAEMLSDLGKVAMVDHVSLVLQDELSEV
jgi:hypothetical protein